jgi:diguanylate cyclase (GGDEF)-like protein/PAS domain S-box-containing protein
VVTTALVRQALEIHQGSPSFGPCRGVGFLGMGVLAGALSTATMALARTRSPAGVLPAPLAVGSLLLTATMYLVGLLLLPGAAPNLVARLRRALDGGSIALAVLYSAWLLFIRPVGGMRTPGFMVGIVACCAIAIAVVTGTRAYRHRASALACASGAALAIVGVAGLAGLATSHGSARWALAAGIPIVGGTLLVRVGVRRPGRDAEAVDPIDGDGSLAGYPLLLAPVTLAVMATVYNLIAVGTFDGVAVVLAILGVSAIGLHEALAALDVRRYARRVAAQGAHFRSLVAGSSDVTVLLGTDLVVRWQSPAAARQFGLSDADVLDRPFTALVHPADVPRLTRRFSALMSADRPDPAARPVLVEARLRDGFGRWRDTESTINDHRDLPEVGGFVVHLRDVGERKELERTLHRLAYTDQLTGLANRRELLRTLTALRTVPGQLGALVVVGLADFGTINELRGRETGDAVLVEVARRLRAGVGDGDLPARLGGDSFAVLTSGNPVQSFALATRLLNIVTADYPLPGLTIHVSASVGLADIAGPGNVDEVLHRCDVALRRARQLGRNRVEWYDETVETAMLRQLALEHELPGVVDRGELDLVYQPVLELSVPFPVGVESLLRWRHPRLGTIPPDQFAAAADELGLGPQIGEWVLHRACRQISSWLREGRDVWVSVNLAGSQLRAHDLVARVSAAIEAHEIPADRLVLEIAEHDIDQCDQPVVTQLAGLRALGVRIALDRFGTGPTSLAHLRRLPVDILKLDRSLFADPTGRAGPPLPIIEVIVSLGRRLGLDIVAQGLEAEAHLDAVRRAGCRYGQGYLFSRPAPAERVEAYLEAHRSPSM